MCYKMVVKGKGRDYGVDIGILSSVAKEDISRFYKYDIYSL